MNCPICNAENIAGAENCAECCADLADLDRPIGVSEIESHLLNEQLAVLCPAEPITIAPSASVSEAIKLMAERGVGSLLVVEGDALLGIFTERDVLRRVVPDFETASSRPVRDFMTADPDALTADTPVGFALNRMAVGGYRHVPIVEDGKPVGVISVRDVLKYMGNWYPDILAEG